MTIENRKNDHIDICLDKGVKATRNWWDDIILLHSALPSCDMDEVDLRVDYLGKRLEAPLIISAMTGGSQKAKEYNEMLSRAAEEFGIGMGVGSQRASLERKMHRDSYEIVKEYDIPLILGNIGAPQLSHTTSNGRKMRKRYSEEILKEAVEMVGADGVCVHLNYLQEVVQPEGETTVTGVLESITDLSGEFKIVAKETGAGISRDTAMKLKDSGVASLDVGGLSGTTFAGVESYRGDKRCSRIGRTFWDWGIPTPISVIESDVGLPLISTGGLRNGLDVARSLALGADIGGMAWILLKAASQGYESLREELSNIIYELKTAIFLTGGATCSDLDRDICFITGPTHTILKQIERNNKPD